MASKRDGSFNHYGDRNQQFHKRQRTDRPVYNSATYDADRNGSSKPQRRNNFAPHQRTNVVSTQPKLSATEMQTGLVSLLDRFVADETTPGGDRDVLQHARELRRLLCLRNNSKASGDKRELDAKRPDQVAKVVIPAYIERKVQAAKDLPPLPPIAEPHLHKAAFTHRSAHVNSADPRTNQNFNLDIDYERLEFLGDAYIELIASRALYNRFPHVDVPQLCSWRERLVENSNLGKFSEAYDFPSRLTHTNHWEPGSSKWQKVVADIFEAYVAALVLSDPEYGFNIAEEWLTALWAPQLLAFKEKIIENPQARNELNKLVVVTDIKLECREERPMTYDSGSIQRYYIGIYLTGWGYTDEWLGSGEGRNKAQAGVAAAADALKQNSPALQHAMRQKQELMEVKRREQEEKAKPKAEEEEANATAETLATDDTCSVGRSDRNAKSGSVEEAASKKRKSDAQESSPDKKKKKPKKDKKEKEKKRKASTDDDSA